MMRVFACNSCARIHLEIGRAQIHFHSLRHIEKYLESLDAIDVDYYAAINRKKGLEKVIIIPLADNGTAHLGFTVQEFQTLKETIRNYLNKNGNFPELNFKIKEIQAHIWN